MGGIGWFAACLSRCDHILVVPADAVVALGSVVWPAQCPNSGQHERGVVGGIELCLVRWQSRLRIHANMRSMTGE
jgi:hypothetical protein